jgi:hypothetical protein
MKKLRLPWSLKGKPMPADEDKILQGPGAGAPLCPLLSAPQMIPQTSRMIAPGQVMVQVQLAPIPCVGKGCRWWTPDDPHCAMLHAVNLLGEIADALMEPEAGEEAGEPAGKAE